MPNRFCNLTGTNKIKDEFSLINNGFAEVENDLIRLCIDIKNPPEAASLNPAAVDGSTDDTTPVQQIIDYLWTNGGGVVLFPKGTCIMSHITPRPNVILRGLGKNISIIKMKNGTNADFINALDGYTYYGIENLTLDGNKANNTAGAVLLLFGSHIFIRNVEIKNSKTYGIYGVTGADYLIKNCYIHDCEGVGILFGVAGYAAVSDFVIDACVVQGNNSHGISIGNGVTAYAKQGVVSNCVLSGNGANDGGGGGVWVNSGGSHINIHDNIVYNNDGDNIAVAGGTFVTITGNSSSAADGPTWDTVNSGIALSAVSSNITVIGNLCWGNTAAGIIVRGTCYHVMIANNICWNNSQDVAGNFSGIQIDTISPDTDSGNYVIVESNRCYDDQTTKTQGYGIKVDANADEVICRNNILSNNLTGAILNNASANKNVFIIDNLGYNPVTDLTEPTLTSGAGVTNNFCFPVRIFLSGGTITAVYIQGVLVGTTDGMYVLQPNEGIQVNFSVQPSWIWIGM